MHHDLCIILLLRTFTVNQVIMDQKFSLENFYRKGQTVVLTLRQGEEDYTTARQWADKDTSLIISLMTEYLPEFHGRRRKKKDVWIDIANRMQENNFLWNSEDCRKKWSNMIRTFKTCFAQQREMLNNMEGTGGDGVGPPEGKRIRWPFFMPMYHLLSLEGASDLPESSTAVGIIHGTLLIPDHEELEDHHGEGQLGDGGEGGSPEGHPGSMDLIQDQGEYSMVQLNPDSETNYYLSNLNEDGDASGQGGGGPIHHQIPQDIKLKHLQQNLQEAQIQTIMVGSLEEFQEEQVISNPTGNVAEHQAQDQPLGNESDLETTTDLRGQSSEPIPNSTTNNHNLIPEPPPTSLSQINATGTSPRSQKVRDNNIKIPGRSQSFDPTSNKKRRLMKRKKPSSKNLNNPPGFPEVVEGDFLAEQFLKMTEKQNETIVTLLTKFHEDTLTIMRERNDVLRTLSLQLQNLTNPQSSSVVNDAVGEVMTLMTHHPETHHHEGPSTDPGTQ